MAYSSVYSTLAGLAAPAVVVRSPLLSATQLASNGSSAPILLVVRPNELIQLLPTWRALAKTSIVLQVSTCEAHSHDHVLALRDAGFTLIYSADNAAAATHAPLARDLAAAGHRGVVHFGEFEHSFALTAGLDSASIAASGLADDQLSTLLAAYNVTAATYTGPTAPSSLILALGNTSALVATLPSTTGLVSLTVYRPLSAASLRALVPSSVERIAVLDQSATSSTKWAPLFLDVVGAFAESDDETTTPLIVSGLLGRLAATNGADANAAIAHALAAGTSPFTLGSFAVDTPASPVPAVVRPKHESTYTNLLSEVFGDRLWVANAPSLLPPTTAPSTISATSPEYALGHVLGADKKRAELRQQVQTLLAGATLDEATASSLGKWLANDRDVKLGAAAAAAVSASSVTALAGTEFVAKSNWIIGSEAWSHDLGSSGLHHALSTGANVNLLLIDTTPYHLPTATDAPVEGRRKDAGLYAMNYGGAYVASVAVYGDFSQTLRAMAEADQFKGPSIVLAYLPSGDSDSTRALEVLKSTKKAIDIGTWPLYRWDPSAEARGASVFELDSERIKADLRTFLDRQNHLTELSSRVPNLGPALESGSGKAMVDAQKRKARAAFDSLAGALEGPPLLILYASDGGATEKLAKKFNVRARAKGVAARILAFDDLPVEDLPLESNVVFMTSVAGQGEFPQNGRELWKALQANKVEDLSNVTFSVFGMGDSHYWPRKEDAHYYNKSCKDLNIKLLALGATAMVEMGLGDDQDPDGHQTAYKIWEPQMWKALGVDSVESAEVELEPITNEHIKIASNFLRGTIVEGLADKSTGALAESDGQLTKFHGIYQQDDRDIREERKAAGLEPAYSFMVRMRLPAGVCKPDQWLAVDEISDKRGNGTFKLTTRQTFQFHGIIKSNLKPAMQEINKTLLDTVAACGDVNRTVMCSANPSLGALHEQVFAFAKQLSDGLMPRTSAYAEIWLDKKMVAGDAVVDHEPLYGDYYLPRKFKIAIAVPPYNDVDVFCHDLGYIAILSDTKELLGFNVTIGGGMGTTNSVRATYPRLADVIGFITPEQGLEVAIAVMTTQRDNGNRANRKNARVKYTIDRMTLAGFVAEMEKRLGYKLAPAKEYTFTNNVDHFGWQTGDDGRRHFTAFVENGRVQDEPGQYFKTALREIAKVHKGVFRLTANQHVIIADIPAEEEATIQALLTKHGLDNVSFSALRLSSAACVALPSCGLAMAESERYLPELIGKVEALLEAEGLRNDSVTMRMTGCGNGCSRPWAAEIAFVGKAPGQYIMMLGGGYYGQRLNSIYNHSVDEAQILEILAPMFKSWAANRLDGEHFGDYLIRAGIVVAAKAGLAWHDGAVPPQATPMEITV